MEGIDVLVFSSSLHDEKVLAPMRERLLAGLQSAASSPISEVKHASPQRLTALLILTGGVERDVLKVVSRMPAPILLIAHPGNNSLPAALEVLARVQRNGGEGRVLFGDPTDIARDLEQELAIANAWDALQFSRIGLIGEPSEWLVASDVDAAFLKGRLAIELVTVPMDDLVQRVTAASASRKDVAQWKRQARDIKEATPDVLRESIEVYEGLRSLVDEHRLNACTVRCFDLVERLKRTGCYALARLNDEDVPSGCEGDMQALMSLYVAFLLSRKTAFMGNVTAVDPAARTVDLAHCTCAMSLLMEYSIRSHFESGLGAGIAGTMEPGPCTLFRLGGERLDQVFVREGEIRKTTPVENGCRTQVRVALGESVDDLLARPLGNHHILLRGHHRATIERFFNRFLAT